MRHRTEVDNSRRAKERQIAARGRSLEFFFALEFKGCHPYHRKVDMCAKLANHKRDCTPTWKHQIGVGLGILFFGVCSASATDKCDSQNNNPCCDYSEYRRSVGPRESGITTPRPGYPYVVALKPERLPKPPDSAITDVELAELRHLRDGTSAADGAKACLDHDKTVDRFLEPTDIKINLPPVCSNLFRRVAATVDRENRRLKGFFKRERPYRLDPNLRPLKYVQANDETSYPSGHAAYATIVGLILVEMLPEKRSSIYQRIEDYGYSRLVARLHYRSDVDAGHIEGAMIRDALFQDEEFKNEFNRCVTRMKN
jgi:acid phosphatase (class A)